MSFSPATPIYDHREVTQPQQHLPSIKHLFESIIAENDTQIEIKSNGYHQLSPPHQYDETEDDSDSSPSRSHSPKQSFQDHDIFLHHHNSVNNNSRSLSDSLIKPLPSPKSMMNRRKSVPYKSPTTTDKNSSCSVVFQLLNNVDTTTATSDYHSGCGDACDQKSTTKIISGQSLLSKLRKRVEHARNLIHLPPPTVSRSSKRRSASWRSSPSIIEIPQHIVDHANTTSWVDNHHEQQEQTEKITSPPPQSRKRPQPEREDESDMKRAKKTLNDNATTSRRTSSSVAGRPSRVKGPCQACNEASDGCMRKAFNWPFPASQIFNDKGKPFVYLCNKCGLRYNKSGGCVCRHCRWVFCKEEKRKALQHIEAMRRNRPDGHINPDEDIENFLCSPKYWTCGRKWKVGWVLNDLVGEEEEEYTETSI